jgi:protein phosphatase
LTIANVGDSRAYLMRDDVLRQVTRDHSLVAGLLADGIITEEEAIQHPQRNVILYSLGSAPHEPRIDVFPFTLRPDDVILLCTDGLTRYADDKKVVALLTEEPREEAAKRLIDFANESGGADNVTVAVIRVIKTALPRWVWWLLILVGAGLVLLSGLAGLALAGWNLWGT